MDLEAVFGGGGKESKSRQQHRGQGRQKSGREASSAKSCRKVQAMRREWTEEAETHGYSLDSALDSPPWPCMLAP